MTGRLPRWLLPLTIPLSVLYGSLMRARSRRYQRGRNVKRINRPVISIGNITTGGTGKTPFVRAIARELLERGHRPMIAMRGYGSSSHQPSDEELEYRAELPDVPIAVNPDRAQGIGTALEKHTECDVVILDDGFQHQKLARDLDVVLIDATQGTFMQRVLPAGHLREPLAALSRADAVVLTRADGDVSSIKRFHGKPPIAQTRQAWREILLFSDEQDGEAQSVDWLGGKAITIATAVGNNRSVIAQARRAGATVIEALCFRDHHRYTHADAERLAALAGSGVLLVTMKDWVKLGEFPILRRSSLTVAIPRVEIEFVEGSDALWTMIDHTIASFRRDQQ